MTVYSWKTGKLPNLMKYHQKYGRQGNLTTYCSAVYNQNTIERWTKGYNLPFLQKGDLRIAKNHQSIILTSIAVKMYNALLLNCIKPEIEKILWKNQNGFQRNRSTTSQIMIIRRILGVRAKNSRQQSNL